MTDTLLVEMIDALEEVATETLLLVRGLDDEDGDRPTDLAGWTVSDVLAHVVGLEQVLAGRREPTVEVPEMDHVGSDFARYMESHVQARRCLPLSAIADELAGLLPSRIDQLRSAADSEVDPVVASPFGELPLSESLGLRLVDMWAHEHDIRRAVGAQARLDGLAASLVGNRLLEIWSKVLPSRVDYDATLTISVSDGPSASVDLGGGGVGASLSGDLELLGRLGFGRGEPEVVLGQAETSGPDELFTLLAPALAFTP